MAAQLLREMIVFPTKGVLRDTLGKFFEVLEGLKMQFAASELAMTFDWHYYYRDNNGGLCKVCHKKKTIFWLSVWENFFKTSFGIRKY
jgi:hypothetical protein